MVWRSTPEYFDKSFAENVIGYVNEDVIVLPFSKLNVSIILLDAISFMVLHLVATHQGAKVIFFGDYGDKGNLFLIAGAVVAPF